MQSLHSSKGVAIVRIYQNIMDFGNFTLSRKLQKKLRIANRIITQNLLDQTDRREFTWNPNREVYYSQDLDFGSNYGSYSYDKRGRVTTYSLRNYELSPAQAAEKVDVLIGSPEYSDKKVEIWEASKLGSFQFAIKPGSKNFKKHASDFGQMPSDDTYAEIAARALATQNGLELASFLDDQLRGIASGPTSTIVTLSDSSSRGWA